MPWSILLMTAWLVVKGGPDPGKHLVLLQNYFVGYSISWPGSIIGMFYGAALGAVIGWFMGLVYNWTAAFRK